MKNRQQDLNVYGMHGMVSIPRMQSTWGEQKGKGEGRVLESEAATVGRVASPFRHLRAIGHCYTDQIHSLG